MSTMRMKKEANEVDNGDYGVIYQKNLVFSKKVDCYYYCY